MTRFEAASIDFDAIRSQFEIAAEYPSDAVREAENVQDAHANDRVDRREIEFVTIDPPGARDLDQAVAIERTDIGYRIRYAIADVGAFVTPGGALDTEAWKRGQTLYLPDGNSPLYPVAFSEGSASLLPGVDRAAVLWTIDTDDRGVTTAVKAERALVRSRRQFTYSEVQEAFDAGGSAHPSIALLPEFGTLRAQLAVERGAVELALPDQSVEHGETGYSLTLEARTPSDGYNAQISLLTGMAAGSLMAEARIGLLRTLPPAGRDAIAELFKQARALGFQTEPDESPAQLLSRIEPATPASYALMSQATKLLRGAGYAAFVGTLPELTTHAGVASTYAHATAPLRRLGDRYTSEVCLAISGGYDVPSWASDALQGVADVMAGTDRRASDIERAVLDQFEAQVLQSRIGETFEAVVLRASEGDRGAEIYIAEPPIIDRVATNAEAGDSITVRVDAVDTAKRTVDFSVA